VSLKVYIRPEAERDIESAALWYEKQKKGLGNEFLDEVLGVFETISNRPNIFSVVHRETRRAIIHRFPFGVFYRIEKEKKAIVVIAVMHCSRNPKRWQLRV